MSEGEIDKIDEKLQKILDILLGDGDEKPGLVAKVHEQGKWIDEQKKRSTLLRFDLFRAFLTGAMTILIASVMWIAGKVSKALEYDAPRKVNTHLLNENR